MSFLNIATAKGASQAVEDINRVETFACPMQQYFIGHYGTFAATVLNAAVSLPAICTGIMDLFSKLKGQNLGIDQRNFKNFQIEAPNMNSVINKYGNNRR